MLQVVDLRLFTFCDILLHSKRFEVTKGRTSRDRHRCQSNDEPVYSDFFVYQDYPLDDDISHTLCPISKMLFDEDPAMVGCLC